MPQYLPSKKVFLVALGAIVLLVFTFVSQNPVRDAVSGLGASFVKSTAHASVDHSDTDNDGLYDWEEQLLGTDAHDSDSDGDGVSDGEQFAEGKIYPEIRPIDFEEQFGINTNPQDTFVQSGNLTESLLTSASINRASLEGTVDRETQLSIIDGLATGIEGPVRANAYALSDIATTNNTREEIDRYLLVFLGTLGNHSEAYTIEVLDSINNWDSSGDEASYEALDKLKEADANIAQDLLAITAPEILAPFHLAFINNFNNSAEIIEDIKLYKIDPIKSMLAAAEHTHYRNERSEITVEFTRAYNDLTK